MAAQPEKAVFQASIRHPDPADVTATISDTGLRVDSLPIALDAETSPQLPSLPRRYHTALGELLATGPAEDFNIDFTHMGASSASGAQAVGRTDESADVADDAVGRTDESADVADDAALVTDDAPLLATTCTTDVVHPGADKALVRSYKGFDIGMRVFLGRRSSREEHRVLIGFAGGLVFDSELSKLHPPGERVEVLEASFEVEYLANEKAGEWTDVSAASVHSSMLSTAASIYSTDRNTDSMHNPDGGSHSASDSKVLSASVNESNTRLSSLRNEHEHPAKNMHAAEGTNKAEGISSGPLHLTLTQTLTRTLKTLQIAVTG